MGYGAPLQNQNKGYAAQEKKDLLKDNPVAKAASGGSWMSKYISSPLAMGKSHSMAPKMESDTPLEGNAHSGKMAKYQEAGMSKQEAYKKASQDLKK